MEESLVKSSQTAQLAAAHRAYHLMKYRPSIFEDSAAIWLLEPPLNVVLRVAPLRWLFWNPLLTKVRPISTFIVLRSRYTEDWLDRAISEGCTQYVILGAGLDSWALRHEEMDTRVFELDQSSTQEWKQARIQAYLGYLPSNLILVPIDFERENLTDVLLGHDFDGDSRAFVSWLGTICYLPREAIEATFASLAEICTPGSRLVFDYFQPKTTMSPEDLQLFEVLDEGGTRRGEPMESLLNPEDVASILGSVGFRVLEDLSASEIRSHYLNQRSDELDIPGFVRLCCAERQSAG
jgi:methyltransferase (TIGR00027 family)